MRKISIMIAAMFAFTMMATSAMAQLGQVDSSTYGTKVNIEVAEEVQLWASDSVVDLVLDGANAENSAAYASSLNHINNVEAVIDVGVTGELPEPIVTGGGIQFFIFDHGNEGDALDAIAANSYTPSDALVWTHDTLDGNPKEFAEVDVSTSIDQLPIVYGAAAPGELPMPDTFELVATWTIAPQNN